MCMVFSGWGGDEILFTLLGSMESQLGVELLTSNIVLSWSNCVNWFKPSRLLCVFINCYVMSIVWCRTL
jgi:hypothetical protein